MILYGKNSGTVAVLTGCGKETAFAAAQITSVCEQSASDVLLVFS